MKLRTALAIAAALGCMRPAVAALTNMPLTLVEAPPQVFVHESGPSVRAARPEDGLDLPVYDAFGDPLLFTLDKWRAGNGTVDIEADSDGAGDRVTLNLRRLIAFGHYSVFVRTDSSDGPHYAPLDGSGLANNFDARVDGSANIAISSPVHIGSGESIVMIYHSDAADHGNSPGDLKRTAHEQLAVKIP